MINPYNHCTANRMVNGKQQTILWNVDDCKISGSKKTNDEFIEVICDEYETIFKDGLGKMTVSRGKKHKYLGMDLDFTTKGEVKVTMADYTKECIKIFDKVAPLELETKSSAAASNLFEVDEDSEKLSPRKAEAFHNPVAKNLFETKRARPNTGLPISFLTTRVRDPSKQDWKNWSTFLSI